MAILSQKTLQLGFYERKKNYNIGGHVFYQIELRFLFYFIDSSIGIALMIYNILVVNKLKNDFCEEKKSYI